MIQDSLFAESFWNPVYDKWQLNLDDEEEQTFELYCENNLERFKVVSGQLYANSQYINLLETYVILDERGVTLQNKFGQINVNGPKLQQFYKVVDQHCMHLDIQLYYEIEKVLFDLEKFQVLQVRDKQSGMIKSIKKYAKMEGKEYLKQIIRNQKHEYLYEDEHYLYIVISYLNGKPIIELSFEQSFFGLLKMLYKYHNEGLVLNHFQVSNIILLDDNCNMEVLDNGKIEKMTNEYSKEIFQDVQLIKSYLISKFPKEKDTVQNVINSNVQSVQELLFNEIFINYFGESEFYRLLNSQPYQRLNHQSQNSNLNLLETFNTIRSSIMDSSDELEDVQLNRQFNFSSQQFDDSPMLSPSQKPKHQSRLSSRQVVLETLLQENIITQQQFQQFYREEDFQNEQEINEFSEMLTKEIENSSLTTPIQSDSNTTCPNTVIIHSKKNAANRICDILHEAQQELIQAAKKPYNVNKVQNVRKNLFNLH
ncbi:unnamed protein product (macronuclear) [Paramecium tetraurelia]|uniref:Protein kinase domain-containing protein n=1 Tax=Paramecium tetraurelia TaxID=5888 RepID=A0BAT3_PARTE|nr:uncharacterized protein GSPATT00000085001 [Paramecium tetraurelia]CAK55650.1 unnamed protein product [Paramecium tetraurelia]|eukprot:XP_001423048.1 hypothetical protein (macronuclear) [Paramecium tetraurelia strain d4-2]